MNNLVESLKQTMTSPIERESPPRKAAPNERRAAEKKSDHDLTQDQLAEIYFSGAGKVKKSETPMVVRVVEKAPRPAVLPWAIALLALAALVGGLLSGKRVFVDVKVLDGRADLLTSPSESYTAETRQDREPAGAGVSSPKNEFTFGDTLPMHRFEFEGAAALKSARTSREITLVNSSVAPFARAALFFREPINLSGAKIVFYAKGARGGEKLALSLKDRENVSAFSRGKFFPFSDPLTTEWQRAEIPISRTVSEFDPRFTTSLRFEFGSKDTENKPGDTILVKDLQIHPI